MGHKPYNIPPKATLVATSVGADQQSSPSNIFNNDYWSWQIVWTGTLNGSFKCQVSSDYNPHTAASATWDDVPSAPTVVAAGSPGHGTLNISFVSSVYTRLYFTYSSGSGNITATFVGKAI